MARQTKPGILYFSHDTNMMADIKIKLLKAKHGLIGYAIYLRLLEELYSDKGYYLPINENFNILFVDDNNLSFNVYNEVLNDCILFNLFTSKLYEKYSILTSERIQHNYCEAVNRRKKVEFIKEYLLIDTSDVFNSNDINVNILTLNVYNKVLNVDIGTQSKVKESKVKESKVDNSKESNQLCVDIIDYLNYKLGKNYKPTAKIAVSNIKARVKEKYTLNDFKIVIDKKVKEWQGTDMQKYLTPDTLFGNKFDKYLNQLDEPVNLNNKKEIKQNNQLTKAQQRQLQSDETIKAFYEQAKLEEEQGL